MIEAHHTKMDVSNGSSAANKIEVASENSSTLNGPKGFWISLQPKPPRTRKIKSLLNTLPSQNGYRHKTK
jgi:hypothetical protein